jgi:hypothetical protein
MQPLNFVKVLFCLGLKRVGEDFHTFIDTTPEIAESIYFSLSGVDGLHSKGLRYVVRSIFSQEKRGIMSGVDLASRIFTV